MARAEIVHRHLGAERLDIGDHPLGGLDMDKVKERAAIALPQLLTVAKEKQA